uniref:Cytochrome P450 n=1 Tax=Aegilops tauschii subsp. strangulata TaxID=200361 RepID=A0A453MDD4_AEGTS
ELARAHHPPRLPSRGDHPPRLHPAQQQCAAAAPVAAGPAGRRPPPPAREPAAPKPPVPGLVPRPGHAPAARPRADSRGVLPGRGGGGHEDPRPGLRRPPQAPHGGRRARRPGPPRRHLWRRREPERQPQRLLQRCHLPLHARRRGLRGGGRRREAEEGVRRDGGAAGHGAHGGDGAVAGMGGHGDRAGAEGQARLRGDGRAAGAGHRRPPPATPCRRRPAATGDVEDFVDVMLDADELDTGSIKSIILDVLAAATATTFALLEWAMAELINHPHEMRRLQAEVRSAVGPDPGASAVVTEAHLPRLPYLKAVINETLRLHPPSPLLLPRETLEDTRLLGYDVPAGTRVLINDFSFLPFGAGRRGCPGVEFAMLSNELALASLVHGFDWELPGGRAPPVDMSELYGISVCLKAPLLLVAKPWSSMDMDGVE